MRATYSQDLRLCVLGALDSGQNKMSVQVSRTTIDRWLALRESQGHVQPKKRRGKTPVICDMAVFEAFATRHRGATLEQMAQAWQQETGVRLSRNTFSVALRRLGWTRKKRVSSTKNATPPSAPSL